MSELSPGSGLRLGLSADEVGHFRHGAYVVSARRRSGPVGRGEPPAGSTETATGAPRGTGRVSVASEPRNKPGGPRPAAAIDPELVDGAGGSGGRRRAASTASPDGSRAGSRLLPSPRSGGIRPPIRPSPRAGGRQPATRHTAAATAAGRSNFGRRRRWQRDHLRADVEDAQAERPLGSGSSPRTPARPRRSGAARARPRRPGSPRDGARTRSPRRGRARRGRTRLPPRAPSK